MTGTGTCIVVGGGIAGIAVAAGLAPVFKRVIILEKDSTSTTLDNDNPSSEEALESFTQDTAQRKSLLQGKHPHVLQAGGIHAFERLLPGFKDACVRQGAFVLGGTQLPGNDAMQKVWIGRSACAPGTFSDPRLVFICATRPLMERCARQMLLQQHANVEWRSGTTAGSLLWDEEAEAVTGVSLSSGESISAALVIETSGMHGKAAVEFFKEKGLGHVPRQHINPGLNYCTRLFRASPAVLKLPRSETVQIAMHQPQPPDSVQQLFMRVEGDLIVANLGLLNRQKCGPEVEDFLEYFKEPLVPSPIFYEYLKDLQPVGPLISWLSYPGTVRYNFEKVKMPDGYVVLGDALASLNPRFGTGMSTACFQAEMLGKLLAYKLPASIQHGNVTAADLKGISDLAQKEAAKALEFAYGVVTDGDLAFDFCKGLRKTSVADRLVGKYMENVLDLSASDRAVSTNLMVAMAFAGPPSILFSPNIACKVVSHAIGVSWKGMNSLSIAALPIMVFAIAMAVYVSA